MGRMMSKKKARGQSPPDEVLSRSRERVLSKRSGSPGETVGIPKRRTGAGIRKQDAASGAAKRPKTSTVASFPVVGLGASAGGLEAFSELLTNLPLDTGMAFVLVQHLDPKHESMLTDLLSRKTKMPVTEVNDGMVLERNTVYVIPPNTQMAVLNGKLSLIPRSERDTHGMPIDFFFHSLAQDNASRAIGVVLSGTASDGSLGLKAIKAKGGITFAQIPGSAAYDGMPRSAIAAGCVDFVMSPKQIANELARIGSHPYVGSVVMVRPEDVLPATENDLNRIFVLIRKVTGTDFTDYNGTTIRRRIARRMMLHRIQELSGYVAFLQRDSDEVKALRHDMLINVTGFFREPPTFDALERKVFPSLAADSARQAPIRIWVPGCSTGEETYSLAISLAEILDKDTMGPPAQIFGTDISEESIEKARTGTYPENITAEISPERLRRFFNRVEEGYRITKAIRDFCVFAIHDLTVDPPFSNLDLISCRNVLIYMGPVLKKKVLRAFHYALRPTGMLVLGVSETIGPYADLFSPIDKEHKIYARKSAALRAWFDLGSRTHDAGDFAASPPAEDLARGSDFDLEKEADRAMIVLAFRDATKEAREKEGSGS